MYSKRHILECMMDENNLRELNENNNDNNISITRGNLVTVYIYYKYIGRVKVSDNLSVIVTPFIDNEYKFISKGRYVNDDETALVKDVAPKMLILDSTKYSFLYSIETFIKNTMNIDIRFEFLDDVNTDFPFLYITLPDDNIDIIKLFDNVEIAINDYIKDRYVNDNIIINTFSWNNYVHAHLNQLNLVVRGKNDVFQELLTLYNPIIELLKGGELNV